MLLEIITSVSATPLGWLVAFILWFVIWLPFVALLEYGTHRWIMHKANRLLDPNLEHLKAHGTHHKGSNDHEFVDMPLKNCLLLTSPALILMAVWGLAVGPFSAVVVPAAALFHHQAAGAPHFVAKTPEVAIGIFIETHFPAQ